MQEIQKIIDSAFDELFNMSSEELRKAVEDHKNGDIACSLLKVGYFDHSEENELKYEQLQLVQNDFNLIKSGITDPYTEIKYDERAFYASSAGAECHCSNKNLIDYTIEYLPVDKREHWGKKFSHKTKKHTIYTSFESFNNSSDDYVYEYAA